MPLCDKCQREIPSSNLMLHQLRCDGKTHKEPVQGTLPIPPASSAAAVVAPTAPATTPAVGIPTIPVCLPLPCFLSCSSICLRSFVYTSPRSLVCFLRQSRVVSLSLPLSSLLTILFLNMNRPVRIPSIGRNKKPPSVVHMPSTMCCKHRCSLKWSSES